jgi:hypothetical protein
MHNVVNVLKFHRYYFYHHLSTIDFPAGYIEDKIPPTPTPLADPHHHNHHFHTGYIQLYT